MHTRINAALLVLLTISSMSKTESAAQGLRAAYNFQFGSAWSATVDLPKYDILEIGPDKIPIDINDDGVVILRDSNNRLLKWTWGDFQILWDPFTRSHQGFINENGTVVTSEDNGMSIRLLYWNNHDTSPHALNLTTGLIAAPHMLQLFGLNDHDKVVFRADASDNLFFVPETRQMETNIVSLKTGSWRELARYTYFLDTDWSTTHGGKIYNVYGMNNYDDTVGLVYEGSGYSSPDNPGNGDVFYDDQYFSLNVDYSLDFEPFAINDSRTILGATLSPMAGMVILDRFGQRYIGPVLGDLETMKPSMSNPVDGLEEIVIGQHFFKRMTECNLSGISNGIPSPDFWQGSIYDILSSSGNLFSPEATCISPNGRIAGTGWAFDPVTQSARQHAFILVEPMLIPDWDRNGKIDDFDRNFSQKQHPWRFWVNDDDDDGDLSRSSFDDFPGCTDPDASNDTVDGLRDIVDFFPVLIDIYRVLHGIGSVNDIQVRLSHDDSALKCVYSQLNPLEVGLIHRNEYTSGFGTNFTDALSAAETQLVDHDGILLSREFLEDILNHGRGILLLEAVKPTTDPLVMELINKGQVVLTSTLPLSISPVESMMRILNLRDADSKFNTHLGPWLTHLENPPNLPDDFLEEIRSPLRTLIHVHGFNWTGEEIPAAHSEVFKRYFQSGSDARYIGVSWHGDAGTLDLTNSSFEYNENVIHAFISAKYLADLLQPFSGLYTSVFAHSLGNMVASSAIVDFGFHARNYFMTNAAVPLEAYLGETADRRHMVHPDWKDEGYLGLDYAEHLLSPNWYRLFHTNDHRSHLKWKDRFDTISQSTLCYNFYSSAEDVLKTGNGDLPHLFGDVSKKEYVWVFNEMVKGTNTFVAYLAGDVHAGWGFNRHWMDWVDPGGAAHPPPGSWVEMPPLDADLIDPAELIAEPFFQTFSSGDPDFPAWGDGSWLYGSTSLANAHLPDLPLMNEPIGLIKNHAKVLSEAIPGHSAPTGSQPIPAFTLLDNVDLDKTVREAAFWPSRDDPDRRNRWLHSDYLNPALPHVWKFYNLCVNQINRMP